MPVVTITSIYLFYFFFLLNNKLYLDLFVCLNVSMPLFLCKGLRHWPLLARWPEERWSLLLPTCPFGCAFQSRAESVGQPEGRKAELFVCFHIKI